MSDAEKRGPLAGLRIVEIGHLGAAPLCCMLLADLGATVLRIERKQPSGLGIEKPIRFDLVLRGREQVAVDLKHPDAAAMVLRLVRGADALVEGYRPGVMERLGLGPGPCLAANPRLVYGRMTGWGQDGPLAGAAGHDINYVALSGALGSIGRRGGPPTVPLNLAGDGAGAMFLAFGLMSALWETQRSGRGQVVDAAMVDAASVLMTSFFGLAAAGLWNGERGSNPIDSGAFFYDSYECADGRYLAVGALEPKFYAQLLAGLGIDPATMPAQGDRARWPEARERLAARIRTRSRDAWCAVFDGSDACVSPVLALDEVASHPHHKARESFVDVEGVGQPRPAPHFSRTPPGLPAAPAAPAEPVRPLVQWGFSASEVDRLRAAGAIG